MNVGFLGFIIRVKLTRFGCILVELKLIHDWNLVVV